MPDFRIDGNGVKRNGRVISLDKARSGRKRGNDEMKRAEQMEAREDALKTERLMAPDRITVPQCHVCQHPFRDWMEAMLVKGMAYKTLGDRVSPPVDRRSIANHYKNHMDLQDTALRAVLEREAQFQNQSFEEGVEGAITKRGVLEIALRKGYEDIINGVTTVEARDLIQIAKVLTDMDSHQQSVGLDELRAQVQIFIQAIKDVCPPEVQSQIATRVKQLRQRENIDTQVERVMMEEPKQIPEAVVVED